MPSRVLLAVCALGALPVVATARDVPVDIRADDGVRLAGTLSVPEGSGRAPAALLLVGFGPHDRDGTLLYDAYRKWADALVAQGVAVLRYDKRGIGASDGAALSWLDPEALRRDAVAAVAALARRPEIDPSRIAIVGHSQGGDIALAAAGAADSVTAVVTLAAPARPIAALVPGGIAALRQLAGPRAARALATGDPRRDARRLRRPLLIVHGGGDRTVPVGDARLLRRSRAGLAPPTFVAVVPELDHELLDDTSSVPAGLARRVARFLRSTS